MKIPKKIQKNICLAGYTTFKIGGPAEFFVKVKTYDELAEAVLWAQKEQKKITIIGGGSNMVINDAGVSGLVIKLDMDYVENFGNKIKVGAGMPLSRTVILAYENSLSGLEWAIGIPGLIGGAVRGNAGAFGKTMSDNITKINIYDIDKKAVINYSKLKSCFKYRSSIFKLKNNLIILDVVIKLTKNKKEKIKARMDYVLKNRILNFPKGPSAGSIFKNIPTKELLRDNPKLLIRAEKENVVKDKKIPAGWIIDLLDLKGKVIGGAKISSEHANVILNYEQASSSDIITLISYIKTKVRDKLKIKLHEEIEYIGF